MFHSDNKEKNDIQNINDNQFKKVSKPEKTLSATNKIIIFIILFAVICIGITIVAIYYTKTKQINNNVTEDVKEQPQDIIEEDNLGVKTYFDKYNINGLEIKTEKYNNGEVISRDSTNYITYRIEAEYDQINGLKNTLIQNEINEEIKKTVFDIIEKVKQDGKEHSIMAKVRANFSNVLSVHIFDYNDEQIITGLNYNLLTGEKLKFEDLFTNTANINLILSQSAYDSFAIEVSYNNEQDPNYVDFSDRIINVVNCYKEGKEFNFYFSNRYIYLNICNENITVQMRDFYDSIAIYNRYVRKR